MGRITALLYSLVCYLIFFGTFLYSIGFLGEFLVPRSINSGQSTNTGTSLLVNAGLLGLFAVQHSLMARSFFKEWWTRIIPEEVERSTYVLFSSLALILLFWLWQPMPYVVWKVTSFPGTVLLWGIFGLGWFIVLVSTFMIDHFELFGLRQAYNYYRRRTPPSPEFQTPYLYKYVRHPLMLGFVIAFWATPLMTAGHLLFAVATTGYILIGIFFEEQALIDRFGDQYRRYRKQVPVLIPLPGYSFQPASGETAGNESPGERSTGETEHTEKRGAEPESGSGR